MRKCIIVYYEHTTMCRNTQETFSFIVAQQEILLPIQAKKIF